MKEKEREKANNVKYFQIRSRIVMRKGGGKMMQQNYALRKNFTAMTLAKRTRLCNITRRHERAGKRQKRRVEITKVLVTVIRQVSSIPALRA